MTEADIQRYMAEAYSLAEYSPDLSNQNGAVVYRGFSKIGEGFNHFYPGIPVTQERPAKYEIAHAEEDACLSCARSSIKVDHTAVMYCPWAACKRCARAIIGAGIRMLVVHKERWDTFVQTRGEGEAWAPNVDEAMTWLRATVDIHIYSGAITAYQGEGILLNGRLWNPATLEFAPRVETVGK